jgi:uncharacterized protein (DUF362 family)
VSVIGPDRRQVLKRLGQAGLAVCASGGLASLGLLSPGRFRARSAPRAIPDHRVPGDPRFPPLAAAHGPDPAALVRAALEDVGGIKRFVQPGETVLLKPNMAWDRAPEQSANTDPGLVAEVVRQCHAAGARRVIVADNPVHDARRVAAHSGIRAAVEEAGGELALPDGSGFTLALLGGSVLETWDVLSVLFQADRLINIPVVKNHSLSRLTCGFKNHMGLLGGARGRLHQEIHACLADLASAFRPTLTIVDATRVMRRGGPTGGRLDDVVARHAVAAGTDPVACDAWAARLLDLDPRDVPHIAQAEGRGLGRIEAGLGLEERRVA